MRKVMSCFGTVGGRCALTILALLVASISLLRFAPGVSAASKGLVFGREVIVDHQRVAGEPSISIDSQDRIYVAAPFGFSTTASFVWRSTDHGQSFHLVPGDLATFGKPTTCIGGGDSALAVDTANRLYFADLQGLTTLGLTGPGLPLSRIRKMAARFIRPSIRLVNVWVHASRTWDRLAPMLSRSRGPRTA